MEPNLWKPFDPSDQTTWPADDERVLIDDGHGNVSVERLSRSGEMRSAPWWIADDDYGGPVGTHGVVAWQPLPEPSRIER